MDLVFAPGCALQLYKPQLANRVSDFLHSQFGTVPVHNICCRFAPKLSDARIITICSGCDRRFRSLYEGITTVSLWEVLDECQTFPFPDYCGTKMSVQDACPTRTEQRVHLAVRSLLKKMNVAVIEPEHTKSNAICCGDSFFGALPVDELKAKMKQRASQMPCEDVVVYCVSCVKAMHIGNRSPHYLLDLLFGEPTEYESSEPETWHAMLDEYISDHKE